MNIKICNYEILNFDAAAAVYTSRGIVRVHNSDVVDLLKRYEDKVDTELSMDTLCSCIEEQGLDSAEVVDFLRGIAVLADAQPKPVMQSVVIASPWPMPEGLGSMLSAELALEIDFMNLDKLSVHESSVPTFYVVLAKSLNIRYLKSLYYGISSRNPDCAISLGYADHTHFHLAAPYLPSIGNPCAFCALERVLHYETTKPSENAWAKLLAFCYRTDISPPTTRLDIMSKLRILSLVVRSIKPFVKAPDVRVTQDRALCSIEMDLFSGVTQTRPDVHWPMCECLERKS